jgi:hypothetical protein
MKMPAKGEPLSAEEVGLLRTWIDQGAPWSDSAAFAKRDPLDWWSLRPLTKPALPVLGDETINPLDAFVRAKLTEHGLQPAAETDARTLIRRMTFDLTGLPPDADEADVFAGNTRRLRQRSGNT